MIIKNKVLFLSLFPAFILMIWGFFFFFPHVVLAQGRGTASVFLGPSSGSFSVGSTFTVSLYLDTGNQFVNALEINLSFPPDKLQVVSPTTIAKSFIDIWASPPSYSNRNGTLNFQGGIHNPGINTESGVISTITFRVMNVGVAPIKILDTSHVFLADGLATDILTKKASGLYYLTVPPPAGPSVTSPTNPNQEKWYDIDHVVLRWDGPRDVSGYSYLLSSTINDDPDNVSEGPNAVATYDDLPDGVHYFHIKSLQSGIWGGITHYAIKIDRTSPAKFGIQIAPSKKTASRNPVINFETTDSISGMDHYELKVLSAKIASNFGQEFFIEAASPYSCRCRE